MTILEGRLCVRILFICVLVLTFAGIARASVGDRLPEFRQCLEVCKAENCALGASQTPIPLHRRLLFWTCASECDHTCQHIITNRRLDSGTRVVQFHGKWPFHRLLGMQEPFSVICSIGNLWAHYVGLQKVLTQIPEGYSLRPFYIWLARFNMTAWVFSSIFHTRDFRLTEELDYLAAGAAVLYGMYYTPVRVFRLDLKTPRRRSILRIWTFICAMLYTMHVGYLKGIRWDYTYNMGANVAAGIVQNLLWSGFSINKYLTSRRLWATWPGIVVAWITFAMSMELFDFPPWMLSIDAHSLWHFFTIFPTIIWYNFLIKDAKDDLSRTERLKA